MIRARRFKRTKRAKKWYNPQNVTTAKADMMSTGKNTADLDLRVKNTSLFEPAQLVGIASMMYTCMAFLDP